MDCMFHFDLSHCFDHDFLNSLSKTTLKLSKMLVIKLCNQQFNQNTDNFVTSPTKPQSSVFFFVFLG